jgi:hypothetical protein
LAVAKLFQSSIMIHPASGDNIMPGYGCYIASTTWAVWYGPSGDTKLTVRRICGCSQ